MKKIWMLSIIIFLLVLVIILIAVRSCSEEEEAKPEGIVLPNGTVLPLPTPGMPLPMPTPPPVAVTPSPNLPGTEAPVSGEVSQQAAGPETEEVTVQIKDLKFIPADLDVAKGTKVTWINLDSVPHTATSSEAYFDSGRLGNGEEFSFVFEEAGSWEYYCMFHPEMKAGINVE